MDVDLLLFILDGPKHVEETSLILFLDANAGVYHRNSHLFLKMFYQKQYLSISVGKFESVGHEVESNLLDSLLVCGYHAVIKSLEVCLNGDVFQH
jgi:hypothetical protein